MHRKLFLIFLLFSSALYCPMTELSFGQAGDREDVYVELMEHVSGFENERFFGPGLKAATLRAVDRSQLKWPYKMLTDEDRKTIYEKRLNIHSLFSLDKASRGIKKSMKNHRRKQIKKGLWKREDAPVEINKEDDDAVSQLNCCKKHLHRPCLMAYLAREPKNCTLCRSDNLNHKISTKTNFDDVCAICQEDL